MRVWTLHVEDGIVPDARKFAELLANNATDMVWVGNVSLIESYQEESPFLEVIYTDDDGEVAYFTKDDVIVED